MTLSGNYSGLLDLFFFFSSFLFFSSSSFPFLLFLLLLLLLLLLLIMMLMMVMVMMMRRTRMVLLSCNMCLSELYQTTKYSKTVDLDPSHGKSMHICKQRRHSSSLTSTLSNQILWCLPL